MKKTVQDLMTRDVVAVRPDDDLGTLYDLMWEHNIRHMLVVDSERSLVGLVTHRDLLRHSRVDRGELPESLEHSLLEGIQVREIMNTHVTTTTAETDIREAAQVMLENKYGCLPVVEDDHLVGVLTEADFVKLLAGRESSQ